MRYLTRFVLLFSALSSAEPRLEAPERYFVSLRRAGYCWRIQSQPRKLFKFGRMKRISSLFGGLANSIAPVHMGCTGAPKAHV